MSSCVGRGIESLKDLHIRRALKSEVLARWIDDPGTLVVDELGLRHGAIRIDLAVLNGTLHGYEIKSDRDTFDRLPNQAKAYNSVFDRITLVVGNQLYRKALRIVPQWWGVKIAEMGLRGGIRFRHVRRSRNNPAPDSLAIAKLLWREEALLLLEDLGTADGLRNKPRAIIYSRLAEVVDPRQLRTIVRQRLKCRTGWRFGEQQMSNGD